MAKPQEGSLCGDFQVPVQKHPGDFGKEIWAKARRENRGLLDEGGAEARLGLLAVAV